MPAATDEKRMSATSWTVFVGGSKLADSVAHDLVIATVEDSVHVPDLCTLVFHDKDHLVISKGQFEIGKELTIKASDEGNTAGTELFKGEVTALEASFEEGKSYTTIRAFDKAHRLYRGRKTAVFKDMTYSDIVNKIASGAGMSADADATNPAKPYVTQLNMSDAEFLKMLAGECGFVLLIRDGKINFKAPTKSSEAPAPANFGRQAPLALVPGQDVIRYSAVVTADSQVSKVEVRGWDVKTKKEIKSEANGQTTTAKVGVEPSAMASKFGNPVFHAVDVPYGLQGEVAAVAKALAEQIAGTHAQLEGLAFGNPALKAGQAVSLGGAGQPFEGKYTVTSSRHTYENGEYNTHFFCYGHQDRTMLGLTGGGGGGAPSSPAFVTAPIPSVVSALVTNIKDPDKLGRVKVKMPQWHDTVETDWLRVVAFGNGKNRGNTWLPEVNDEVVVAFDHGDIRRGYVLGAVHNGVDKPDATHGASAVNGDGTLDKRALVSRAESYLLMDDTQGKEAVSVSTKGDEYILKLDKGGTTIKLDSKGKVEIHGAQDITVKGDANVNIEAASNLSIKATGNAKIEASGQLELKGATAKMEGSGQLELKGAQAKLEGSAQLDLKGGAMAQLQAAIVKIN